MVQAKELADLFEVSVRTIYRDIEVINQAGIPITTFQGAGGGIGLVEGYRLDRNLLTNNDLAAIMTALQSISTSYNSHNNQMLMEKISSIIPKAQTEQFHNQTKQFIVDFSSWGNNGQLEDKLNQIKLAIEQLRMISFTYCDAQGEVTERSVEPYTLVLKQHKWYLYGYCKVRSGFRLFKLFRMKDIRVQEHSFIRQDISIESLPWKQGWHETVTSTPNVQLILRFRQKVKHLAEEWFGVEELHEDGYGNYEVSLDYPEDNWLYGFILSFGQDVEVLQPLHIRQRIKEIAANISQIYDGDQ